MQYRPRKKKEAPYSRARKRNISVRPVRREHPDLEKLARAFLAFAEDQRRSARTAFGVPELDASFPQSFVDGTGRNAEPFSDTGQLH